MKRLILFLSCVALLTAATLTAVFAGTGSVELTASAPAVEAGETVEITATLSGFPEVTGIGAIVTMPKGMTVVSGQWLVEGEMTQFKLSNKQGVWANPEAVDLSADTEVFKLVCKMEEPEAGQQDLSNLVKIKFNVTDASNIKESVTAETTVSVVKSATALELDIETLNLNLNAVQKLTATYGPENTTDKLTWSSSNEAVATVAEDGTVTALTEGEAEITATVGSLTKTCKVTVACTHQLKTEHQAAEATCQSTGNNQYFVCDACGDVFKADGTETTVAAETLPIVSCAGGEATCTAKAKCKWCGAEYGELKPHTFTEKIEDAAHQVPGSGVNCQSLKVYFFDCADCTEISDTLKFDGTTYGDHKMDTNWTTENEIHFQKCLIPGCDHIENEAPCSGGTATCTLKAVCATCHQDYGKTAPHNFVERSETEAYLVPGSGANCQELKKYYYKCSECTAKDENTFDSATYGDHKMDTAWTTENEKHFHKCTVTGCTYIEDEAACSGGEATCTAKAKCASCDKEYGDVKPHSFTEKITDAVHQVAGSGVNCQSLKVYYFDCADCTEISDSLTFNVGTYGDHNMDTAWTTENEKHFHKCTVTGCTYIEDEAACSGGEATCTAKAKCASCDKEYGDVKPHSFTEKITDAVHQVAGSGVNCQSLKVYYFDCADCTEISDSLTFDVGTYGDHKMDTAWTTENEKHFHKCTVTGCTYIEDEAACSGGEATCTAKAKCASCDKEYGATKPHQYDTAWTSTGTLNTDKHYRLCTVCQQFKTEEGVHTFGWITDDPATEDKTGLKHEECITCKVKRNEGTVIDKLDHVHIGIQNHPAVAATCVTTGNVEYWTCSSSKCTDKYYGDADCQLLLDTIVVAVNPNNHVSTKLVGVLVENCYQDGYTGDIHCAAEGCEALLQSGTVIPANGRHTAGREWFSDDNKHWHACTTTGCTAKVSEEGHSFSWVVDDPATEDKTGLKHEECTCGKKRSEGTVIDQLPHKHVGIKHTAAVKATCIAAGNVEYWTCSSSKCAGKYYGDAACQTELQTVAEPINPNNHTGSVTVKDAVAATCSEPGYTGDAWCNSCNVMFKAGTEVPATGKHTPKKGYEQDETSHWQICSHCGTVEGFRKEAHTYKWVTDVKATETKEGSKHQECTVCGYKCNEGTVIDKLEHKPTRVDGKAATCTEGGVIEHFRCKNCGSYYESVDGKLGDKISKKDIVVPAIGHSFGTKWEADGENHWHVCACGEVADKAAHTTEVVNGKDATATEPGYTGDTVCSICEYLAAQGQEIPVLQEEEPTVPSGDIQPQEEKSNTALIVVIAAVAAAAIGGILFFIFKKRK